MFLVLWAAHIVRPGAASTVGVLGVVAGSVGVLTHWVGTGATLGADPDVTVRPGPGPAVASAGFAVACAAVLLVRVNGSPE